MHDIKKINGKYYDFTPDNESFILTAKELKALDIKNYYFMLRVDNPRVVEINPFNPNITAQEVQLLMHEYRHNMWYFMRTAVRMRTDRGVVPYCLHRGLAAAAWCFERSQDNCLCEPRQTYKTTGTIGGPILWAFQLSTNCKMHFFGKETDNTKRNLAHVKSNIEVLPEWLQFRKYIGDDGKVKKSRQATEKMENNQLKNSIEIHPKATSLSHAQGMGRGGSGTILYFDEIEHTLFVGEILANSAPLYKTAADNAAMVGAPHCRLMSCTPGNLDTKEGSEAMPIIKSMIPWTEKIYDMNTEQLATYKSAYYDEYHGTDEKRDREVIDVFYIEYQYYQVRKTYDWVLEQYKLSGDKMAIRREILLQRLRGSNQSPISPEDIEYLISNMKKSTKELLINGKWLFKLYEHGASLRFGRPKELDESIPYIVGIDPAGGGSSSGDNFAITIVNPYNLKIAAEFKSPYLGGPAAVKLLEELVNSYIPNAVITVEKNSMGIYLIQMILNSPLIRDNLYWSESLRQLEDMTEEDGDNELKSLADRYKKYGTYTSKKVRDAMFELLFQHVELHKDLLLSEYLVNDICKLIKTPTGKFQAIAGEHDDSLMSYLHAIYVYYTGDNLLLFGIDKVLHPIQGNFIESVDNTPEPITVTYDQKENASYEEVYMEEIVNVESRTKELVNTFAFVHDGVYSKVRDNTMKFSNDEFTDIPMHFFDSMNGI